MSAARCHAIERTSPKGGPFIGTCILCGEEGLPMSAAGDPCPNPSGASPEAAIIALVGVTEAKER